MCVRIERAFGKFSKTFERLVLKKLKELCTVGDMIIYLRVDNSEHLGLSRSSRRGDEYDSADEEEWSYLCRGAC